MSEISIPSFHLLHWERHNSKHQVAAWALFKVLFGVPKGRWQLPGRLFGDAVKVLIEVLLWVLVSLLLGVLNMLWWLAVLDWRCSRSGCCCNLSYCLKSTLVQLFKEHRAETLCGWCQLLLTAGFAQETTHRTRFFKQNALLMAGPWCRRGTSQEYRGLVGPGRNIRTVANELYEGLARNGHLFKTASRFADFRTALMAGVHDQHSILWDWRALQTQRVQRWLCSFRGERCILRNRCCELCVAGNRMFCNTKANTLQALAGGIAAAAVMCKCWKTKSSPLRTLGWWNRCGCGFKRASLLAAYAKWTVAVWARKTYVWGLLPG